MAYSTVLKEKGQERGMDFPSHHHFEKQISKRNARELCSRSSSVWTWHHWIPVRSQGSTGYPALCVRPGDEDGVH